jgi:tryptophan synthase alpha chain
MKNQITELFERLKQENRKAFMPFIPAGDPDLEFTTEVLRRIASAGADLIEVGFPFSDPIADGPVIQASYTRALEKNLRVSDIFLHLKKLTQLPEWKTPLVAMVSYSLIYRIGLKSFIEQAKGAGISGVVIPDLPVEEAEELSQSTRAQNFSLILLIAPTTSPERAGKIVAACSGFVYCISVIGITGERDQLPTELREHLQRLRTLTQLPLCVGFGVSKPHHVRMLKDIADGVIVGSALVRLMEKISTTGQEAVLNEIEQTVRLLSSTLNSD